MCCLAGLSLQASASDWLAEIVPAPAEQTYEASAGADAVRGSWSVYGGLTSALFGDVREDGWRVRTSGGYGQYRYVRSYFDPTIKARLWPEFKGRMMFADALLGYQQTFGPLTIKAFGGMTEERHDVRAGAGSPLAFDDENAVQGDRRGFKGALETWMRWGNWGYTQADFSWSSPYSSYSGRLRLGYRLNPSWSAGLEASAFGNVNHDHGRAGGFLRYEWERGEVSISAGADGDQREIAGAYGSLAMILKF